MKTYTSFLSLACLLSLATLNANVSASAMIDFSALMQEVSTIVSEPDIKSLNAQQEIVEFLESALIDEAVELVNTAKTDTDLADIIHRGQEDLQEHVVNAATDMSRNYVQALFSNHRNQTIAFITILKEIATHEKVILRFTAPWCPTCQFMEPMLERCAVDYAPSNVRIISIDVTQCTIPGIPIEKVPTLIFFKNGTHAYLQTGFNGERVQEQLPNPSIAGYEEKAAQIVEDDLRACINQYLLA